MTRGGDAGLASVASPLATSLRRFTSLSPEFEDCVRRNMGSFPRELRRRLRVDHGPCHLIV